MKRMSVRPKAYLQEGIAQISDLVGNVSRLSCGLGLAPKLRGMTGGAGQTHVAAPCSPLERSSQYVDRALYSSYATRQNLSTRSDLRYAITPVCISHLRGVCLDEDQARIKMVDLGLSALTP